MAYITLNEIKEILPEIMRDWIDKDDESWEWIFQEIEQKCHVGKKKKKKCNKMVDIDALIQRVRDLNKEVEEMHRDFIDTKNNVTQVRLSMKDMSSEIKHIREDSKAAKSMAEIAKNRTETDYSKISSSNPTGNTDWAKAQAIIMICESNGITGPEWSSLYSILSKYVKNYRLKENIIKDCLSCKHYCGDGVIKEPCTGCENCSCWEAKDE